MQKKGEKIQMVELKHLDGCEDIEFISIFMFFKFLWDTLEVFLAHLR